MRGRETEQAPGVVAQPLFATTHWSVVLTAGKDDCVQATAALEQLCRTYWYPLYVYVRRRGHPPEDAKDLTQQFFARFLQRGSFSRADPARGRFRAFLLKSLQHFLADEWKRAHREKRGGGAFALPLDGTEAEARYAEELADVKTPEVAYEERWAVALLERALGSVREDYIRAGKEQMFEALQDFLGGPDPSVSYGALAKGLAMTEGALRGAIHRLREHYRQRLRTEVAHTVSDPAEVEAELRYLASVVCPRSV